MKIGLVGGSSQESSLPLNAQRSVNLFPVVSQGGKETSAMYGAPGKVAFSTGGSGVSRGSFSSDNQRSFYVIGASLIEILSSGSRVNRGNITTSSGNVTISENGLQLAICDERSLFIFTYADNTLVKVSDPDFPPFVLNVTYLDGYFIVPEKETGKYYISALYDGLSWRALDFKSAESSPDNIVRVFAGIGQLWLFGAKTTEIHTNTGDSTFPFERIPGTTSRFGCLAANTVVEYAKTIIWLGRDEYGSGTVYATEGFNPTPISTSPIAKIIQESSNLQDCTAYVYQENDRVFYVLTGGGLPTSLVYDITTKQWHERAHRNEFGSYEQDIGRNHIFAFGKHLVGSRKSSTIYEVSMDYYTDGDDPILRERIYTHIGNEDKRQKYSKLAVGFEVGVGLQDGQGSNPIVTLEVSKDGGKTWSEAFPAEIGKVGQYGTNVEWRRLGISEITTFRLRTSEPVKIAITGSYLF